MRKSRVLVIDDDASILRLTRFHLEKQGFEVATAEDGLTGLNLLAESYFKSR